MFNSNILSTLNDVLVDINTVKVTASRASTDGRLIAEFDAVHQSLQRCRELIQASAALRALECSVSLNHAAPLLKTIGLHPDGITIALLRSTPDASGEDYVLVSEHELRDLADQDSEPESATPSHFVRKALRGASDSMSSRDALRLALNDFIAYCGATDHQTLVHALIAASYAYRLAQSVSIVLPVAVTRTTAPKELAKLVRATFPSADRIYCTSQIVALADRNLATIPMPEPRSTKSDVESFARRHGYEFATVWRLHNALLNCDPLHDAILDIQ